MIMELKDDEYKSDEKGSEQGSVLRESVPLPWEKTVREFEDYLRDIGVRIWLLLPCPAGRRAGWTGLLPYHGDSPFRDTEYSDPGA